MAELYDSGASRHMSCFSKQFTNYHIRLPCLITAVDKRIFYTVGMGDLRIEVPNGKSFTPIILKDVLHALDMSVTIVSINCITKARYSVLFDHKCCGIWDKNHKYIGHIPVSITSLYKVKHVYAAAPETERVSLATMHKWLTHIAPDAICKMISSSTLGGVKLTDKGPMPVCNTYEQAKAMHKQIQKECKVLLIDVVGVEIHIYLWGPSLLQLTFSFHFLDDSADSCDRVLLLPDLFV
jgi:hypothetical protein